MLPVPFAGRVPKTPTPLKKAAPGRDSDNVPRGIASTDAVALILIVSGRTSVSVATMCREA